MYMIRLRMLKLSFYIKSDQVDYYQIRFLCKSKAGQKQLSIILCRCVLEEIYAFDKLVHRDFKSSLSLSYILVTSFYNGIRASIACMPNIQTYDVTFEHGFMFNLMRSIIYYIFENSDKVNKAQTSINARKIFSSIQKESLS